LDFVTNTATVLATATEESFERDCAAWFKEEVNRTLEYFGVAKEKFFADVQEDMKTFEVAMTRVH